MLFTFNRPAQTMLSLHFRYYANLHNIGNRTDNTMESTTLRAQRATRFIFLVCGIGVSSWAPMVPQTKERLMLNDADLGLLLLLLGGGGLFFMPITSFLIHHYGSRKVIIIATHVIAISLPSLLLMNTIPTMAVTIFIFGAGVGAIDVAMNAHAVHVQGQYGKHIMSSFHGLFSIGGLFGSLGLGFLIKLGLSPILAACSISMLLLYIVYAQKQHLFYRFYEKSLSGAKKVNHTKNHPNQVKQNLKTALLWFDRSVLFLGSMCFITFLTEGAMLDWSSVLLREEKQVDAAMAGAGYAAFSVAMASMRMLGDGLINRVRPTFVVCGGAILGTGGLLMAIFCPTLTLSLVGFILLGLGTANIVPIFFSEAGKLKNVPPAIAIPAISTIGYAGQLAGPALLGFIAYSTSLPFALNVTAVLLLLVSISYFLRSYLQSNQ